MSTINVINTAAKLLQEGKWSTVLSDTSFTISSVPQPGQEDTYFIGAVPLNNEPFSGFLWKKTKDISTRFIGVPSVRERSISFESIYNNKQGYIVSKSWKDSELMYSYSTDIGLETNQWTLNYVSSKIDAGGDSYITISMPVVPPPNTERSIATTEYTDVRIRIISPSSKLLLIHCSDVNNVSQYGCVSYCSSLANGCSGALNEYCYGSGINTQGCIKWCRDSPYSSCDDSIGAFCKQKLLELGNVDILLDTYNELCSCFLPDDWQKGYANSLRVGYGIQIDNNTAKCYFPPCSLSKRVVSPSMFKTSCNNCDVTSGCILGVTTSVEGFILAPPLVNSSKTCANFNRLPPDQQSDIAPVLVNACKPDEIESEDANTHPHSNKGSVWGIAVGITVFVIVGGVASFWAFNKSRNKRKKYRR